ncbi:MAG: type IV toxin-antitoxin system AbiEi family antitoxin domain-containing protein, partial [Jatrophihabitans sp.]
MHLLPPESEHQFGVFTSAQALAAGWTSHALRHAVAHDYLVRVRVGVYCDSSTPAENRFDEQIRHLRREAAAFSLTNSGVPVSHSTAGAVLGLELVNPRPSVCATFLRGARGPMPGVHRHRGRLAP